ncbi:MAG: hypothetical protein R3Y24_00770 [Eubacteriales bacterium]
MRRTLGFIAFWIAIGMLIMIFITNKLVGSLLIALIMLVGYLLYNCR